MTFGGSSGDILADRRFEYGQLMAIRGDLDAACELYGQALEITSAWPPLHFHLAETYRQMGRKNPSISSFKTYLSLDPDDHMGAAIKLALLGEEDPPETLPVSYVQSLFDEYAPRFDDALINDLEYTTPEKMAHMVRRATNRHEFARLLDLGCGTGLATAEVAILCRYKTGVDLSPVMIEQAKDKNLFDELHVGTIEGYLSACDTNFDLILCADVLVYIGVLEQIFLDCAKIMNGDALFAFSVQYLADGTWILGEDHRYAHSQDYIESCLKAAGLVIVSLEKTVLRKDGGNDIEGIVVLCRK